MLRLADLLVHQTVIVRQRNGWLKPQLSLAVWTLHMNVHSGLFSREKSKIESYHRGKLWDSWTPNYSQKLSLARNDEVERRGVARKTNGADLSQSSTPLLG